MTLEQEPFRKYNIGNNKVDSVSVRLNTEERKQLEDDKRLMHQTKDSTAIKILMKLGTKVLHEEKTRYILGIAFKNKRNNERQGINDFD